MITSFCLSSNQNECLPLLEGIRSTFKQLANKVYLATYFAFQNTVCIFNFKFRAICWNCKNFYHLISPSAFLFNPLSYHLNYDFSDDFSNLLKAYQEINNLEDVDLKRHFNKKLSLGGCHAECLELINLLRQEKSLLSSLSLLKHSTNQLVFLQLLETFRFSFESAKRDDLMQQIDAMLPQGLLFESEIAIDEDDISQELVNMVSKYQKALIITRLYNRSECHSILLSIDNENQTYGFYSSNFVGYYEYNSLKDYTLSFYEFTGSHTPHLKRNNENFWHFAAYSV